MIPVEWAYLTFAALGLAAFKFLSPRTAVLTIILGGFLFLPTGRYPPPPAGADPGNPWWITCVALPGGLLLFKGVVFVFVPWLASMLFDFRHWRTRRESAWALAGTLWLLWVAFRGSFSSIGETLPIGMVWFAAWQLGERYFADPPGRLALLRGFAYATLAYLPICIAEGIHGPFLYDWLYGPHPFTTVGAARYLGYRPLGFLEDGNQLGMFLATGALASFGVALHARRPRDWAIVAIVAAMTLASQSIGAIALMLAGAAAIALTRLIPLRTLTATAAAIALLAAALYLSGLLPLEKLRHTPMGESIAHAFHAGGRGSFTWRIAQDQKLLKPALLHRLTGTGHWDWWRPEGTRPWGLDLLIVGQFGLIGLALAYLTLAGPALWRGLKDGTRAAPILLTTACIILAANVVDSVMNCFLILPLLLVSGGLAGTPPAKSDVENPPPAKTAVMRQRFRPDIAT